MLTTYIYIQSRFQKDLAGCLLSPQIKFYVKTALEDITVRGTFFLSYHVLNVRRCFQELVRSNHDAFKIPSSVVQDADKWKQVTKLIALLTSRIRGAIKVRVRAHLLSNTTHVQSSLA